MPVQDSCMHNYLYLLLWLLSLSSWSLSCSLLTSMHSFLCCIILLQRLDKPLLSDHYRCSSYSLLSVSCCQYQVMHLLILYNHDHCISVMLLIMNHRLRLSCLFRYILIIHLLLSSELSVLLLLSCHLLLAVYLLLRSVLYNLQPVLYSCD